MFIEKQDTKGGTYFIFPYLCIAFKLKIIEIWTIQTRERAQLVLIKANRAIED